MMRSMEWLEKKPVSRSSYLVICTVDSLKVLNVSQITKATHASPLGSQVGTFAKEDLHCAWGKFITD